MYRLIITPWAEDDATDAANWYNEKRDALGDEFLLALDAKMNTIRRNPKQFRLLHRNIRRALIDRFPYGVFYVLEKNVIYVLAILHTSRDTNIWENRR